MADSVLDELRAEERRISDSLYRAEDTFSQMLLAGKLKAVQRQIEARRMSNLRSAIYDESPTNAR